MAEIDKYRFQVVASTELTDKQMRKIDAITIESLIIDFPDYPKNALQHFASLCTRHRRDLNGLTKSSLMSGPQRLGGQSQHIMAFRRDTSRLVAALPVADNVSASRDAEFPSALMKAKLHIPGLETHRYYWAGFCALKEEARQSLLDTPPDEASITDALLVIGSIGRHPKQPGRAYPYIGERVWSRALEHAGYTWMYDRNPIEAFGPSQATVGLVQYGIESVAALQTVAGQKSGMEAALRSVDLSNPMVQ